MSGSDEKPERKPKVIKNPKCKQYVKNCTKIGKQKRVPKTERGIASPQFTSEIEVKLDTEETLNKDSEFPHSNTIDKQNPKMSIQPITSKCISQKVS